MEEIRLSKPVAMKILNDLLGNDEGLKGGIAKSVEAHFSLVGFSF